MPITANPAQLDILPLNGKGFQRTLLKSRVPLEWALIMEWELFN